MSFEMPHDETTMPSLRTRLVLCTLMSILSFGVLLGKYISSTLFTYEIVHLVVLTVCWFGVATVFVLEDNKNLASNYCMQIWVVAAFMVHAVRLQVGGLLFFLLLLPPTSRP